jgi:hypothetical protein
LEFYVPIPVCYLAVTWILSVGWHDRVLSGNVNRRFAKGNYASVSKLKTMSFRRKHHASLFLLVYTVYLNGSIFSDSLALAEW